jgi:hypothetical protein
VLDAFRPGNGFGLGALDEEVAAEHFVRLSEWPIAHHELAVVYDDALPVALHRREATTAARMAGGTHLFGQRGVQLLAARDSIRWTSGVVH